ncbi:MAG TPA: DUF1080 domain-containing protein [Ohtaekwangia sp.]|nr:DUF1080 domain-containing protein [Ohtaekwangia sp.]
MNKGFTLVVVALIFYACQTKKMDNQTATDSTRFVSAADNQLTQQQQSEGWISLFDGTSKNGWRTFKNLDNDSWEVTGGTLHCKPFKENAENKRADLISLEQYENFELAFDWKISPQGNSGVMFHVTEEYDQPYATGPEYQILDDEGYPGDVRDVHFTGANYDMLAPAERKSNAVGTWNSSRLVVNHNHVEHWLNGVKVVEYDLQTADWKKRVAETKWKDFPGYGSAGKGHIALQDHNNEVWFKNIYIKPL